MNHDMTTRPKAFVSLYPMLVVVSRLSGCRSELSTGTHVFPPEDVLAGYPMLDRDTDYSVKHTALADGSIRIDLRSGEQQPVAHVIVRSFADAEVKESGSTTSMVQQFGETGHNSRAWSGILEITPGPRRQLDCVFISEDLAWIGWNGEFMVEESAGVPDSDGIFELREGRAVVVILN